jgi:hypothetical protein
MPLMKDLLYKQFYCYYDLLGGPVLKTGDDPEYAEELGKAYLQVVYDDYMKR